MSRMGMPNIGRMGMKKLPTTKRPLRGSGVSSGSGVKLPRPGGDGPEEMGEMMKDKEPDIKSTPGFKGLMGRLKRGR